MSEFHQCELGQVCSRLSSGKGIPASKVFSTGEYPVYGGNGLRGYTALPNFSGECAIIGRQGVFCGNVRYFNGNAYMTEHAVVAQANDQNSSRYLAYLLSTMNLGRLSGQSAQPGLSVKTLAKQIVNLPSLEQQNKAASLLASLDDKIELNERINHNLEQMAQAIFKSWFVDFEPFSGEMPSNWQAVTLGDLCVTVTKGTTPTTLKRQFVAQGINFVKAESILDDHSFDFSKLAFIDDETNTLLNRSMMQENDIIFTIAGTLGRFAFVEADLLPANTNQAVAIIRADTSKINPITLYSFFIGGLHSDFYTKNIQQAVQANLSLTTIKALPLLLPPTGTIAEYSTLIEPLFEQTFQNYAENRRLVALRDTLLPRLMSGELSVTDIQTAKL